MPGMTGVEAARVLGRVLPSIPILLFTLDVTAQLVEQAKNVGIKGAVQKSDTHGMVSGIEALLRKKTFSAAKGTINLFDGVSISIMPPGRLCQTVCLTGLP